MTKDKIKKKTIAAQSFILREGNRMFLAMKLLDRLA